MRRLQLPFLVLLLCVCVVAQADGEKAIDDFVKAEMERQKIPGVSLAVVKDGKPFIVKGYGFANLEHNVPVKPETIFQSGSVGKQFTAFAAMLLVEEGKIGLDEKIGKYLGEVPPTWANITVRHLLTHTSGMTDYPTDFDFRKDYTEDELLKRAKQAPVAFAPGEKWAYSNLGYVTLGIIVSKVSGGFYGDFLKKRVFDPLGMTAARIISESDLVPNRAAGYVWQEKEYKNQRWASPTLNTTADGSLYLTALDMVKWDDALSNGKLLSKSSYEQMWTPVKLADGREQLYGFGWGLSRLNGKRVIAHSGAWQGFKSMIARYPENRLTVIVFANAANANTEGIAARIAALLDPSLKPVPIKDPDPAASADHRATFEKILKGTIDEAKFTPRIVAALKDPSDRLLAHLKTLGAIRRFELLDTRVVGSERGWRYAVEFDSMSVVLELVRDKDAKIRHLVVQPQ